MRTLFNREPTWTKPKKKRVVAQRVENNAGAPLYGDPHPQWGIPRCQGYLLDVSGQPEQSVSRSRANGEFWVGPTRQYHRAISTVAPRVDRDTYGGRSGLARFTGSGPPTARRPPSLPKCLIPAYSNGQANGREHRDLSAYRKDLAILPDPHDHAAIYRGGSTNSRSMRVLRPKTGCFGDSGNNHDMNSRFP